MGLLGWSLLSDFAVLTGTVKDSSAGANDGDWSVTVIPAAGSAGLLSHDGVTNGDGTIECEVKPTCDRSQLAEWFKLVPAGAWVEVGGAWVSDCGHTYFGKDAVVPSIWHEIVAAGGLLPALDPFEYASRDAACENGKTEIHPITYVLARLSVDNPGELTEVSRYLLLVLTDDDSKNYLYRPLLPPFSGQARSATLSIPYPSNMQISALLTTGSIKPKCEVKPLGEQGASNDLHVIVGTAPETFWMQDKQYDRAAFFGGTVNVAAGGYYCATIELSLVDTAPASPLVAPNVGFEAPIQSPDAPATDSVRPVHSGPAVAWIGPWADSQSGNPRVLVLVSATSGAADRYTVTLTDTLYGQSGEWADVQVTGLAVDDPYAGDVWTDPAAADSPVVGDMAAPGVNTPVFNVGMAFHLGGAVEGPAVDPPGEVLVIPQGQFPGAVVPALQADTLILADTGCLRLYGEYVGGTPAGYRLRYTSRRPNGKVVADSLLAAYAPIK